MLSLYVRLHVVLISTLAAYWLLLADDANALRTYELHDGQDRTDNGSGGERYRYRNGGDGGTNTRSRRKGPVEDDNSNPLFPPRTDTFWEVDKKPRGRNVQQSKREKSSSKTRNQGTSTSESDDVKRSRPNIILILTDDQDIELGSMEYMPETLKVFRENGVEFRHGYVTTPMCCPSRSSMLTGLYVHNHQVYTNNDNCSSVFWREQFEPKTFATYLHDSGYFTSYIGKYLNKYDGSHIPAGWDDWNALLMNSRFYNYTVNRNGRNIRYGNNYERDYYPDSIANDTVSFLNRMTNPTATVDDYLFPNDEFTVLENDEEGEGSGSGYHTPIPPPLPKSRKPGQPFILVVSFPSPHGPEDSAPQYSQMFLNETAHHTPAYNFAPNYDKQWILQVTPRMNSNLKDYTNLLMAKRLQTLQSVDASVKRIMETLKSTGLQDDTYVFYTSDHGYHVGQFGLVKGKSMPYEFDIRVPFFVKTPKDTHPKGTMILEPVLNIDLAPTFLDLGGVTVPEGMDGRSILPLLRKYSKVPSDSATENTPWTQTFLIESSGRRAGSKEVPTTTTTPPSTVPLAPLVVSEDERIQVNELCDLHPYPCVIGQRKYCRREKDRLRFRKCRTGSDFLVQDSMLASCHCSRSKREVLDPMEFDWEAERQKIDEEIEILRKRIDELREKKRLLRHQWMATSRPHVIKVTEKQNLENESSGKVKKKNEIQISILRSPPKRIDTTVSPPLIEQTPEYLEEHGHELPETEDGHVRPMTIIHSEEEDDGDENEEELISEIPSTMFNTSTKLSKASLPKYHHGHGGQGFLTVGNRSRSELNNEESECDCSKLDPKTLRQQERVERKRKKLMSKLRKKQRFLNRIQDPTEREQAAACGEEDNMNCFWHDKQHWRTAPLWEGDSFCFCMNSHNNTFSCLRSINSTHNYLYCQFITGFKMYFDLGRDPFQLRNAIGNLPMTEEEWMLGALLRLKRCQGQSECQDVPTPSILSSSSNLFPSSKDNSSIVEGYEDLLEPSIWEKVFGTRFRRRRVKNGRQRKLHGHS